MPAADAESLLLEKLEPESPAAAVGGQFIFSPRKMNPAAFDLSLLVVSYFTVGTVFYGVCDEDFTPLYALFYATNVGLGIGYGDLNIRDGVTKWFTVFYLFAGSTVVVGSYSYLLKKIRDRFVLQKSGGSSSDLSTAAFMWLVAVLIGVLIAFKTQKYCNLIDALLFTVGNYTATGILKPKESHASLLWTTVSVFAGVPINALFMGEISATFLRRYEHDARSAGDETRGLSERDRRYLAFLEAQLLKAGLADQAKLTVMRAKF